MLDTIFFPIILFTALAAVVILALLLVNKTDQIKELQAALKKLKLSFNNLDEQAKLILKTDLELNQAQEELDKRLISLGALQRTSRLISTTLDEEEIFRRLNKSLMLQLGFERILVLIFDANHKLQPKVINGFSKEQVLQICQSLTEDPAFRSLLQDGRSLSSATAQNQKNAKVAETFGISHFILSPILTQDGTIGLFFVGNPAEAAVISEADEEMLSILTNQISQSLENANLFEEVYKSRQELELKIQDRTRELALALEKVQKISRTKSEFVSAVSHELRTPLTSIKGYASILLSERLGEIPEKVKERLEKINKHSDSLVELINNLLDISRIESGRVEMKFEEANMLSLVENARDILMPQIKEKNLQFILDVPAALPAIIVDASQIERVMINLLSNAVKYTPSGTITVKAFADNSEMTIEVEDTGAGIRQEDIGKLFTEFYRVDNETNKNIKGTGLGLALVRNIIAAHQGRVWVTSTLGAGTTFHFTIPLTPPQKENNESKEEVKT